jgi:signal peptidase II
MADAITPSHSQERLAQTKIELPPTKLKRVRAYGILWSIAVVTLALDQITKALISAKLAFPTYGETEGAIVVIPSFFHLVHVGNTGAAWSILSGKSFLLAVLAAATLVGIYFWRHSLGLRDRVAQICFGLLCGGITGNLIDRVWHGHVIDFIDLHFGSYIYPTFNVADSGICIGVLLYLWHSLRTGK